MIAGDAHSRLLFQTETVRGRQLQLEKQQQAERTRSLRALPKLSSMSIRAIATPTANAVHDGSPLGAPPTESHPSPLPNAAQQAANSPRRHRSGQAQFARQFLRSLMSVMPITSSALLAMGYVHVSVVLIQRATEDALLVFMGCSIALKLLMQELAKCTLLRQQRARSQRRQARPPNKYAMMLFIATPTILIEIQVRSALLQVGSASVTVMGALLLGVVEVAVRVVKMLVVQRSLSRRVVATAIRKITIRARAKESQLQEPQRRTELAAMPAASTPGRLDMISITAEQSKGRRVVDATPRRVQAQSAPRHDERPSAGAAQGSSHNRYLLVFHAAETFADMYAEYLAMGCSYATLMIFGDHPHYRFRRESGSSVGSVPNNHWGVFALQVGIEVVVDAVACVLEVSLGVEFQQFNQNDGALLLTVATLAFANMAICAGLYVDA